MSLVPVVTATPNKTTAYAPGEAVTITFSTPADTRIQPTTRLVDFTGHDDEGNVVNGNLSLTVNVVVADNFTLDLVKWRTSGVAFGISGLIATGTAA